MADIWFDAEWDCCCGSGYQEDDDIIDEPFMRRRFFFLAVKLSWPLSVLESLSESELDESELDDEDDELELLELSDAKPVLSSKFTRAASSASAGSFSCNQSEIQLTLKGDHAKNAFDVVAPYLQYTQPFLWEFRTSTYCLVPDNREIRFAAKVLCNRNGIIQVDYNVPPATRHEDGFAWLL